MNMIFSKSFVFLLLTILLAEMGSTMVTPLMPFLFFASHPVDYGYAVAAIRAGAFLASILLSMAMDYWGRRWVLFVSCFGLACSMGVVALAVDKASFGLFIFGIFFSNLLYAGKQTTQAMIGDEPGSEFKLIRMSLLQCGIAMGACLGPIFSGNLLSITQYFDWGFALSFSFWVAAFFGILASLVVVFCVRESMNTKKYFKKNMDAADIADVTGLLNGMSFVRGPKAVLKRPEIKILLLQLFLTQISWGTYYEFSPLIGKLEFGFTASQTGFFVGSIAFWLILGSGVLLPLLRRRCSWCSIFQLKVFSVILMWLGVLMLLLAAYLVRPYLFWGSAALMAIGDVMVYALLVNELSDLVPSFFQGRITGLVYVVFTVTWTITGILGGHLTAYFQKGTLWMALSGVSCLLLYWFLLRVMYGKKPKSY
jgi:MFS family permease